MPNPRLFAYARALETVYETHPGAAHAIEQYVADLRAECARRRRDARDSPTAPAAALPTSDPTSTRSRP